ncbi:MAG: 16S rRNA (cytidine(1402)-2'-O)-methyltransferase [Anaerolineae bacterium]|nr:16S rRNA (cytidine(1402)-2'-O)-methyltransferase [Anaerolineae bacterium]
MGTLYLVGTPIGNLEDVTLRALQVLEHVPLIAAEDTRCARVLLDHHGIATPLTSYFEGNKLRKLETVLAALETGDVALISEAGMPGLSDPGYELVRAAVARNYAVVPIPGPSAPIAALVASGLPTDRFLYLGFLPRQRSQRLALLQQVARFPWTLVAFETPHRLLDALHDLAAALGPQRPLAVCRELTKHFEEIWRGTIAGAGDYFGQQGTRGEFTLVIGGAEPEAAQWDEEQVRAALVEQLSHGQSLSQAARQVAALSGWQRRAVYELGLEERRRRVAP